MFNFLIHMIGIAFGAFLGFILSAKTFRLQQKAIALAEFRIAFFDDILTLKDTDHEIHRYITKGLKQSEPRHLKALEIIKPYLTSVEIKKIEKAYEEYKNPKFSTIMSQSIQVDSFSLYDFSRDELKKNYSLDKDGKELALENLEKIINAVK